MSCFAVEGGRPLVGELTVQGAKNSALPILAATLLIKDKKDGISDFTEKRAELLDAIDELNCL